MPTSIAPAGPSLAAESGPELPYSRIAESLQIGLYRTRFDGVILHANEKLAQILGYASAADLIGMNAEALWLDSAEREHLQSVVDREGVVQDFEMQLRRRDRGTIWVRFTVNSVRTADGRVDAYEGMLQDITERKRIEIALRESELQYRWLFQGSTVPMWITNRENLAFLAVNAAALRQYGYTREQFLAMTAFDVRPSSDASLLRAHLEHFLQHPPEQGLAPNGIWRHRRKDGSLFWADTSWSLISFDGYAALLVQATDVSERIQNQERRERHSEKLGQLLDVSLAIHSSETIDEIAAAVLAHTPSLLHADEANLVFAAGLRGASAVEAPDGSPGSHLAVEMDGSPAQAPGSLSVRRRADVPFDREDEAILAQVARVASLALRNVGLVEQLQSSETRLRELSRRLVDTREDEQRRIARELHDQIGQLLTGLSFLIHGVTAAPNAARPELGQMSAIVSELMTRVQSLVVDLRPAALDSLGLLPALLGDIERFQIMTRVKVDIAHSGLNRRFSPDLESAAFRIVQEALTNIARHAGVDRAIVRIEAGAEVLKLRVEDRGDGFEIRELVSAQSAGLAGMQERAAAVGGMLTIDSKPGGGTSVYAELPLGDTR